MEKRKTAIILAISIIVVSVIFSLTLTSAEVSYCCEKTNDGAWCQNAPQAECDSSFRTNPTSCEATSYCKLGTCVDSQEGTCMENTPQQVCESSNGVWEDGDADDIGRCQLGCCLIGDQAAFVTQTRCKRLSSIYALEIDFRIDMQNELQCIMSASSGVMGACVYEKEFTTTCRFVSQNECDEMSTGNLDVEFHEGFLCSDETLATDCAPTKETTCVEGEDVVRFIDSCGNLANVYDSTKVNNKVYWSKAIDETESCGYGDSNADNAKCGNCDYLLGSTCKEFNRGEDRVRPNSGDNICRDLSCDYQGRTYQHGETWCADSPGVSKNLPGSRYFRQICYNGEVQNEPCADYRQETCIEDSVNGFKTAACRVNMWQDCYAQDNFDDCLNSDRRDCKWQEKLLVGSPSLGATTVQSELGRSAFSAPITGAFIGETLGGSGSQGSISAVNAELEKYGACVPKYAPGFDFWQEGSAGQVCSIASQECVVTYEKKFTGKKECVENCWCIDPTVKETFVQGCNTLGDCGLKRNYLGQMGRGDTTIEKE